MYSASLGRYLSPEPKLGATGKVLGHDRYSHALNDPNTYVDPDGQLPDLSENAPRRYYEATIGPPPRHAGAPIPVTATEKQEANAQALAVIVSFLNPEASLALTVIDGIQAAAAGNGTAVVGALAGIVAHRWLREPTVADKAEAWRRVGGTCPDCGVILTDKPGPNQMNLDHPEPFSTHGPIDPSEAVARCRTCNLEKTNMSLSDWVEYVKHGIWTWTKGE